MDNSPRLMAIRNLSCIDPNERERKKLIEQTAKTLIETAGLIAKSRRALYDAYIEEGFTKEEALELCSKA